MMFLVQTAHCRRSGWNQVVDKEEQCILRLQMDSLSDQEVKLTHSQVRWNQILFLVQVPDPGFGSLFHDHLMCVTQSQEVKVE